MHVPLLLIGGYQVSVGKNFGNSSEFTFLCLTIWRGLSFEGSKKQHKFDGKQSLEVHIHKLCTLNDFLHQIVHD